MQYQIEVKDQNFFSKNHYLQFPEFFDDFTMNLIMHLPERDAWRNHAEFKKLITSKQFRSIISELAKGSSFRLLFDQKLRDSSIITKNYCFQNIALLLLISEDKSLFLFSPRHISEETKFSGRLIGYGELKSRYVYVKEDPWTHLYKDLGYGFGDALKDQDFPLLRSL